MTILQQYLQKQKLFAQHIESLPDKELQLIVVIPCYNEPDILPTLNALARCIAPSSMAEVIVVVNNSAASPIEVKQQNERTLQSIVCWKNQNQPKSFALHTLNAPDLPIKHAGVGLARKTGIDEAIYRFQQIGKDDRIIVSFDADSLCAPNYLVEIEQLFHKNPKLNGCSIYFEHPISNNEKMQGTSGIIQYEMHLRYLLACQRLIKLPYAFHTVGSSFAVRASAYARQGGMNMRQAGEDFYFLHKIISLGNYVDLNSTCVYPSARTSNRVPFGTGAAMKKFQVEKEISTYSFNIFSDLNALVKNVETLYKIDNNATEAFVRSLPLSIQSFLAENNFEQELEQINQNTASLQSFVNRFYAWFNAFRVVKFLNFASENYYAKQNISIEVDKLLQALSTPQPFSDYERLMILRNIDKKIFI
jgi:glycosyltransferase involved in cell wall biosynthesis